MTCENTGCARGGFVEDTQLAVPGGRVSVAVLETNGSSARGLDGAGQPGRRRAGRELAHRARRLRAGRAAGPVTGRILDQPASWRARIRAVTIDMSTAYQAAACAALPRTLLAVDPFHAAQLATKTVGDVRRRATHRLRHRRGSLDLMPGLWRGR
jgi:hypothetical protein